MKESEDENFSKNEWAFSIKESKRKLYGLFKDETLENLYDFLCEQISLKRFHPVEDAFIVSYDMDDLKLLIELEKVKVLNRILEQLKQQ